MKRNDNPIFTMIPPSVLAKAKALAEEFQSETDRKDFIWRHVLLVTAAVIVLLCLNIANGYTFAITAHGLFHDSKAILNTLGIYALAVAFGGTAFSINALVAWLESIAPLRIERSLTSRETNHRLYSSITWGPLIPLLALPAAFNAFFNLTFFLFVVSAGFVALLIGMVASDA
jgi:hypothetical protein